MKYRRGGAAGTHRAYREIWWRAFLFRRLPVYSGFMEYAAKGGLRRLMPGSVSRLARGRTWTRLMSWIRNSRHKSICPYRCRPSGHDAGGHRAQAAMALGATAPIGMALGATAPGRGLAPGGRASGWLAR